VGKISKNLIYYSQALVFTLPAETRFQIKSLEEKGSMGAEGGYLTRAAFQSWHPVGVTRAFTNQPTPHGLDTGPGPRFYISPGRPCFLPRSNPFPRSTW
jgi:hypothetical protein